MRRQRHGVMRPQTAEAGRHQQLNRHSPLCRLGPTREPHRLGVAPLPTLSRPLLRMTAQEPPPSVTQRPRGGHPSSAHSSPRAPGSQVPCAHVTGCDPERGRGLSLCATGFVHRFVLFCPDAWDLRTSESGGRPWGWHVRHTGIGGTEGGVARPGGGPHRTDRAGSAPRRKAHPGPASPPPSTIPTAPQGSPGPAQQGDCTRGRRGPHRTHPFTSLTPPSLTPARTPSSTPTTLPGFCPERSDRQVTCHWTPKGRREPCRIWGWKLLGKGTARARPQRPVLGLIKGQLAGSKREGRGRDQTGWALGSGPGSSPKPSASRVHTGLRRLIPAVPPLAPEGSFFSLSCRWNQDGRGRTRRSPQCRV